MDRRTFRLILSGLTLSLVALIAFVVVILPSGGDDALPEPIEKLFPLPGDSVVRQTVIEIDMPVGYTVDLEVDGVSIPPFEMGYTEAIGLWRWQPGPGQVLEVWPDGEHVVTVRWDRVAGGRPDPGEFSWRFRVQ